MRSVWAGIGGGALVLVVALTVLARSGMVTVAIVRPEGHLFWYASRAFGVTAYLALAASMLWGLLLSTGVGDSWISRARSVDVHKWISAVGLILTGLHGLALVGDGYVAFDTIDLLVPFAASYRPAAVALGIVSLYLSVAVYASFWARRRLGQRTWRMLHYLAYLGFLMATLHGLLAGSDTQAPAMRLMYVVVTLLVLWLTWYRVIVALMGRSGSPQPATARPAGSAAPLPPPRQARPCRPRSLGVDWQRCWRYLGWWGRTADASAP